MEKNTIPFFISKQTKRKTPNIFKKNSNFQTNILNIFLNLLLRSKISFMKKATTIFTAMLMAATATAQTPTLIKSLNNGCGNHRLSNYFAPLKDGRVFFPLCANSTDAYAYATDGTAAGTTQINVIDLELNEGIVTEQFQVYDPTSGKVFFSGRNTSFTDPDIELWSTDGTVAGTTRVKDIVAGLKSSSPEYLTSYNNKVFFACKGALGLWASDGTAAGTVKIKTLSSDAQNLRVFNGKLYFFMTDPVGFGKNTIWESDGTTAGTKQIYASSGEVTGYTTTAAGLYIFDMMMTK